MLFDFYLVYISIEFESSFFLCIVCFITTCVGSTIDEICGLFGQVNPHAARHITDHAVHLCYKNDQTGWLMALVESPPDEVEAERQANRYTYEEPCGM